MVKRNGVAPRRTGIRVPALIAAIVVALSVTAPAGAVDANGSARWQQRSAMPTPRHEHAFVKSDGLVYVLGGLVEGLSAVPLVDVYDPETDEWTTGPPLPYAPNHAMAAARGGVVYHLGGYLVGLDVPTDRAVALVDGAWEELPPMPEPRAAAAAEFVDGKLYVVGGVGPGGVATESFVFDPATREWSEAPGPRTPREHHTLVRYRGFLYALGGRALTFETTMPSVERFNPDTGRWSPQPDMPYATAGHVSVVTRNRLLVVLGGEGTPGPFADAYALDLRTKRWFPLPALDPARTGFAAAAFGSVVYAFGGAGTDPAYYDLTEAIDLRAARPR